MLGDILLKLSPPARVVSVWRHDLMRYDYYVVPKGIKLRAAPPPPGRPAFGEALEALLPSLPQAAVRVGHGDRARGRIVIDRTGRGGSHALGAFVGALLDRMEV